MVNTVSSEAHAFGCNFYDKVIVVDDVMNVIVDAAVNLADICTHGRLKAVKIDIVC